MRAEAMLRQGRGVAPGATGAATPAAPLPRKRASVAGVDARHAGQARWLASGRTSVGNSQYERVN